MLVSKVTKQLKYHKFLNTQLAQSHFHKVLSQFMLMEQQHILVLCFLLASTHVTGVAPLPRRDSTDASLLCISECGTCPLICSPPPAPIESKPQPVESKPPPVESKPPPSPKSTDPEPPPYLTPIYGGTPPQSSSKPPPTTPKSSPKAKSCPPPSYIEMGSNAPPPPPKLVVVPASPNEPIGQKNYSLPYYYFYTSKGVTLSHELSGFVILFISFQVVFLLTA